MSQNSRTAPDTSNGPGVAEMADRPPGAIMGRPEVAGLESVGTAGPEEEDYFPDIFEAPSLEGLEAVSVAWAPNDRSSPCYSHLLVDGGDDMPRNDFECGKAELELLIKANRYLPQGTNDVLAFGFRGAKLRGAEKLEGVDRLLLSEVRPDHSKFRCVIGYYFRASGKLTAYTASTVPWSGYMLKGTKHNMLPTGCYIYRLGTHSYQRPVFPALRLSNDKLEDGAATVMRSTRDRVFDLADDWDNCVPTDNIHCAYGEDHFSSLGCQTIKGKKDAPGLWRDFQQHLRTLKQNDRVDYLLFTGADVAIAGALVQAGKSANDPEVQRRLGRLRNGSEGEEVKRLQVRLGLQESGYFGAFTKKKLTDIQKAGNLPVDGIYSPALDAKLGWGVFGGGAPIAQPQPPAASTPIPAAPAGSGPAVVSPLAPPATISATPAAAVAAGPADSAVASPYSTAAISTAATLAAAAVAAAAAKSAAAGPAVVSPYMPPTPIPVPGGVKPAEPVKPDANSAVASPYQPQPPATQVKPATPSPAPPPQTATVTPATPPPAGPKPAVMLTAETLKRFAPKARPEYLSILGEKGDAVLSRYGINANSRRFCHFMAQVGHECGGFTISEENLNYSAKRMVEIFGPGRHSARITMSEAQSLVGNKEAFAERVYGLGNPRKKDLGNTQPGDGYRYRGRGFLQITGRSAYHEASKRTGVDFENNPDLAGQPEYALMTAADFWNSRKLNTHADGNNIERITKGINGGHNGLPDRKARFAKATQIWAPGGLESLPGPGLESIGGRPVLEYGDLNRDVLELKQLLARAGYDGFRMDEDFSRATHMAVVRFKLDHGLPGDGVVDGATWDRIEQAAKAAKPTIEESVPSGSTDSQEATGLRSRGRWVWIWGLLLLLSGIALVAAWFADQEGMLPPPLVLELFELGFIALVAIASLSLLVLGSGIVEASRRMIEAKPSREAPEPEIDEGIRPEVNLDGVG